MVITWNLTTPVTTLNQASAGALRHRKKFASFFSNLHSTHLRYSYLEFVTLTAKNQVGALIQIIDILND